MRGASAASPGSCHSIKDAALRPSSPTLQSCCLSAPGLAPPWACHVFSPTRVVMTLPVVAAPVLRLNKEAGIGDEVATEPNMRILRQL